MVVAKDPMTVKLALQLKARMGAFLPARNSSCLLGYGDPAPFYCLHYDVAPYTRHPNPPGGGQQGVKSPLVCRLHRLHFPHSHAFLLCKFVRRLPQHGWYHVPGDGGAHHEITPSEITSWPVATGAALGFQFSTMMPRWQQ